MDIAKRLLEIKAELKQLRGSIATAKDEELDGIQEKINKLIAERASLMKRLEMQNAAKRAAMQEDEEDGDDEDDEDDEPAEDGEGQQARSIYTLGASGESRQQRRAKERAEKRAKMGADWKKNNRTVVLDTSVLVPKKQSSTLTGFPFNQVSTILDAVNYLDVIKGESYEEPFIVETGTADYTEQPSKDGTGGEYHEVGLKWDTVKINKTKITAYSAI
jgi:hypothetical protein